MRVPDDFLEGEIRNSFYVESMMKKVPEYARLYNAQEGDVDHEA